jgi:uncharacterized protein YbcC (UPF0753/DUF2309 family)
MVTAHADTSATPAHAARTIACDRIAPIWPLDEFITVNPWWGLTAEPLPRAAARLSVLGGTTPLMPRTWFRERLATVADRENLLAHALAEPGAPEVSAESAERWLTEETPAPLPRLRLATDLLDTAGDLPLEFSWKHCVVHEISQFCAARFDRGQSFWGPTGETSLYRAWRDLVVHERSNSLLTGAKELPDLFRTLPTESGEVFAHARRTLDLRPAEAADYFHALLLSVHGWASWCAGERWRARLRGGDDPHLEELLAIRLGWEIVLAAVARSRGLWQSPAQQTAIAAMIVATEAAQAPGWAWQRVLELSYRDGLVGKLAAAPGAAPAPRARTAPALQAYFCIDVRSEVYRRALEAVSPEIETGGFAGFFGLPLAYRPLGVEEASARLPGLLAPGLDVVDRSASAPGTDADADARLGEKRRDRLARGDLQRRLTATGTSAFPTVEALGLTYGWKLLADTLGKRPAAGGAAGLSATEAEDLVPTLADSPGAAPLDRVALARKVLHALSRTADFAPVVLLAGHGGESNNNPHQAGLDCGACCGHAGDVNARALAGLLNDPVVRAGLAAEGIEIPAATRFVAALHNTTTDAITLFDTRGLTAEQDAALARVRRWLETASAACRAERAERIAFAARPRAGGMLDLFRRRAADWAQTRPEWALANNASFIAAPRVRTRGVNLGGRSFLHDYVWEADTGFGVLELILTAPVVVAHWINFQYYASTVDNLHFGSGNKVLHNVVGGTLGVFEGNGGDLRIGLPMQSLHDGKQWMHEPLRLQVVVEAPADAIDAIVARHAPLRHLLAHRWIHLARIDSASGAVAFWSPDGWIA